MKQVNNKCKECPFRATCQIARLSEPFIAVFCEASREVHIRRELEQRVLAIAKTAEKEFNALPITPKVRKSILKVCLN